MSHAMQGHPRRTGHCGEFWQNVVHWRRKWQTTSVFLPQEPLDSMKRQKDRTLKDEFPRSVGAQDAPGEYPVVDMTGDRNKIWWCKAQYCIGTWNVRSMNQGKLEVVKQEMVRVNVDVLGISKLKWNEMGEFNSDDHYIYYCEQESLRRNGVPS